MNEDELMPTRVGGTRWLNHIKTALSVILKSYQVYMVHLSEVAQGKSQSSVPSKATFLLQRLRRKDVIVFAHFLMDLLNILSHFSLVLQRRSTGVYQVHQELLATRASINKLEQRPGLEQRKVEKCIVYSAGKFQGETLTGKPNMTGSIEVLGHLQTALQKRFADIDEGILEATKMVDLTSWPTSAECAEDFGDDLLPIAVDQFRKDLEAASCDAGFVYKDWLLLKQVLYSNQQSSPVQSLPWEEVNVAHKSRFPNILMVIDLLLSLPAGSSECVRGFSQMKMTKVQYRNRLTATTMSTLMGIQLNSPSEDDFDPTAVMHQWNVHRCRRPDFMVKKAKKLRTPIEEYNDAMEKTTVAAEEADKAAAATAEELPDDDSFSDYESDFSELSAEDQSEGDDIIDLSDLD